jgi:hypothetical protein
MINEDHHNLTFNIQHSTFTIIIVPDTKNLEKCGFLAIIVMLFIGTIFGIIGVVLTHVLVKYFEGYYLILIFPIVMAIVLGFGLSTGAKIGRCSRLKLCAALVVLLFAMICFSTFVFLNDYYDKQNLKLKPSEIMKEYALLAEQVQNFLGKLPYVSDYIKPVEKSTAGDLGTKVMDFAHAFPTLAQGTPVVIGTIFDLALFAPVKDYLVYPGITAWEEKNGKGQLVIDNPIVKIWMQWTIEFLLVFLIALLMTRGGTKKAYQKRQERLRKAQYSPTMVKTKAPKENKGLFGKKKGEKEPVSAGLGLTPKAAEAEKTEAQPEPKAEKKGFSLFRREKTAKVEEKPVPELAGEQAAAPVEKKLEMEFPEDQQNVRYALILQQFDQARQSDLVQLIQQVGQVSEDQARRLLKAPSLLKRDVSAQDAKIVIEKFKQVQAQVKLITMEQLLELQKKQQGAQPAPKPAAQAAPTQPAQAVPKPAAQLAPPVQPSPPGPTEERYALILRKFDMVQRKAVLELLSSLSGNPVAQLQQTLKTPALILRDATKDEVTMIAQQFQALQADVKTLTMAELQKLMTKK